MASSSYYYRQYLSYKKEAEKYGGQIKELKNLLKNFTSNPVRGDYNDCNKRIKKTHDRMDDGLRGSSILSGNHAIIDQFLEKEVSADTYLSQAKDAISREITSLESKKKTAEDNRDRAYRNYQSALAAERRAREAAAAAKA